MIKTKSASDAKPTSGTSRSVAGKKDSSRQAMKQNAAEVLGVKPEDMYEYLRDLWVSDGPELTDQELDQGIAMIARFDLDPLAREIYVKRTPEGRTLAVVTIDGWVKILDRCDHYDGFRQLHHTDEDGDVVCVETRIYSKNRKYPAAYRAYRTEYEAIAGMWTEKMPVHMLGNFSFRHCARLFMPLGGNVVTEEEAKIIVRNQEAAGGAARSSGTGEAAATQSDSSIRENDEDPFADSVADSDESWEPVGAIGAAGSDIADQDIAAMFGSFSTMDGQSSEVPSAVAVEPVAQQVAQPTAQPEKQEQKSEAEKPESVRGDDLRDAAFADWMHKFSTIRAAKTADAVLSLALAARSDWSDEQCRQLTLRAISAKQEVLAKK